MSSTFKQVQTQGMLTLVTTAVETVTSSQSGRTERKQNHVFLLFFFFLACYNKGKERFLATVTAKYGIKAREIAQERFLLASSKYLVGKRGTDGFCQLFRHHVSLLYLHFHKISRLRKIDQCSSWHFLLQSKYGNYTN